MIKRARIGRTEQLSQGMTIRTGRAIFLLVFFSVLHSPAANAAEGENFDIWRGTYRISYESLKVSPQESMGLAGLHYLFDLSPRFSAGATVFGAVSGKRGGFFTGGLEVAFRQPVFNDLRAEAGLFVGGGGGGAAPQGGGLMLRPYAGLLYALRDFDVGLQYARIDFPNGHITSDHVAVTLGMPFDLLFVHPGYRGELSALPDKASSAAGKEVGFSHSSFSPVYQVYFPAAGAKDTDGRTKTKSFGTLGLAYLWGYNGHTYRLAEAAGAVEGGADGFAEFFIGSGHRRALFNSDGTNRLFLDWRIAAGAAGGGSVDTGGGFALKTSLGLQYFFYPAVAADLSVGYLASTGGHFRAATAAFEIAYHADFLSLESGSSSRTAADDLYLSSWQAGLFHQTYQTHDPRVRTSAPISLLGMKLMKALTPALYVTGQAWGAYDGDAGGYAVGLLGLRLMSGPVLAERIRFFLEASAGGAGGGGVPVGGGAVAQGMAGVALDIDRSISMEVSYGKIEAIHGVLDSTVIEAGFVYRFSALGRKINQAGPGR